MESATAYVADPYIVQGVFNKPSCLASVLSKVRNFVKSCVVLLVSARVITSVAAVETHFPAMPTTDSLRCQKYFLYSKNTNNQYGHTCICAPACRTIAASGFCCEVSVTDGHGIQAPCFYGSLVGTGKCDHGRPIDLHDFEQYKIATVGELCSNSGGEICWNSRSAASDEREELSVSSIEKRQAWQLAGRVLNIIATITTGPGLDLTELVQVVFGGPGQVNHRGASPVIIDRTEIEAGLGSFTFFFTAANDNYRWHGEVELQEDGDINFITRAGQHPLEQRNGNNWVAAAANVGLQLGCGWAPV